MSYDCYKSFEETKTKCQYCNIGAFYGRIVPSDGCKINPVVLVIGEAPGADEVEIGKPFVGKSGKLLRSTLSEFGFSRDNTLITNTLPCRPEKNKFPSDKNLVASCVDRWLKEEIILTDPKYLLLIGATPTKFLLGMTGITSLRGKWFQLPNYDRKIMCLPTYHPSYVQRKEHMLTGAQIKKDFIEDIKKMAIEADFSPSELQGFNLTRNKII